MKIPPSLLALPQTHTLGNGMRVFFRRTLPSGLVSVQVWVKTGSIHEGKFLGAGLSHFLEHMAFKGTEKFSADEITRRVHDVGGNANAYTTFTRTVFYIEVPNEAAETAFELLAQMTAFPRLDAADAASEKNVILREIDMNRDDPDARLFDASFAEMFRVHPLGVPVIGRKNIFSKMTERELRAYFGRRYAPLNSALVVAGDADAGTVFALAEKYFACVPERPPAPVPVPAEPPQLAPRNVTLRGDVKVLRGGIFWKIPGFAHADAPAISVLASLLGSGDSSLLHRELRETHALVHDVDAFAWTPTADVGIFRVGYIADFGKRAAIEDAALAEIRKIAEGGVAPAALGKARRRAVSELINSLATAGAAAARLGSECVECGDPGMTRVLLEKISALTPDDIRRVAAEFLRENALTRTAFESSAKPEGAGTAKISSKAKKSAGTDSAREAAFPRFEEIVLANGIRVLLQPVNGLPKVHLRAAMLGGGSFETAQTKGATALLSTLLTLDAGGRSAAQIAEEIESVGGRFDENSGNNSFALSVETLSGDESIACRILAAALTAPDFSSKNFRRERASQLAALRSESDEIEDFAFLALRRAFFGAHALGESAFGTETSLAALKLADIRRLREMLVVPANIVIAASGEFERDALLAELDSRFSALVPAAGTPKFAAHADFLSAFKKFSPRKARTLEIAPPVPAEQAVVRLAFPDLGVRDERSRVGTLTQALLSGMASRLFLEIREKRGLAYYVGAERLGAPAAGMFCLCAGTEKAKAEIVLDEMRKELDRLRAGKIAAAELAGAKTRLCVARRVRRQRASARCADAALDAVFGLPVNRAEEEESRISALTADDVARYATEVLAPDRALALIVR